MVIFMKSKTKLQLLLTAALGAIFAVRGLDNTLTLSEYTVRSSKIKRPVNIIFLSDIHSKEFSDGGKELLGMIENSHPDCILFGGDVFEKFPKDSEHKKILELLKTISEKYDNCFFVSGNHENESGREEEFYQKLTAMGMKPCKDNIYEIEAKTGQKVILGGSDFVPLEEETSCASEKLIAESKKENLFSIFLRHVPVRIKGDEGVDLILSGHNHGGLWRFPHTNTGIAGGCKTFFPRYSHGEYKKEKSVMIVGSGIATDTYRVPRLYNTPEVVHVILLPELKIPTE